MERLSKSFAFAWNGIRQCGAEEANFRIHIFLAALTVAAGCYFNISAMEWMVVFMCTGFVICMEMINTVVENTCDLIQKDFHPAVKIIKDISAGAVLLSAVIALLCGAIIFIPKIFLLIKSIQS